MFLDKIVHVMKNDFPLFKNMELYGFYDQLSRDELNYIFSEMFGKPVRYSYEIIMNKLQGRVLDKKGYTIYYENSDGYWYKREYDENGNKIYYEDSDGGWSKYEYDENGNIIYYDNGKGYWEKHEYDENGNQIYSENSNGYWVKWEYNENGNQIYSEDSMNGVMLDKR